MRRELYELQAQLQTSGGLGVRSAGAQARVG